MGASEVPLLGYVLGKAAHPPFPRLNCLNIMRYLSSYERARLPGAALKERCMRASTALLCSWERKLKNFSKRSGNWKLKNLTTWAIRRKS